MFITITGSVLLLEDYYFRRVSSIQSFGTDMIYDIYFYIFFYILLELFKRPPLKEYKAHNKNGTITALTFLIIVKPVLKVTYEK
jgi:hypothetical protein